MAGSDSKGGGKKFDLEERTARFGEEVIRFLKKIKETALTRRLIDQLVGCSTSLGAKTSLGANYLEAQDAQSKKDFRHKVAICRKESREALHFLRMMAAAVPESADRGRELWKEAKELNLIFGAILRKGDDPK